MEAVSSAIASTCPQSFSSGAGVLFMSAVASLVAMHCGIIDDNQWPKDRSDEIISNQETQSYDFIVVGAGTAGSIVASRLSTQFPLKSVLLIEAGDNPGLESEIPAFLFLNQNTNMDWHYKTQSNGNSCLGYVNKTCVWSKGKAMGGSSSINAMLYLRGHPNDYVKWSENYKNWSYEKLKAQYQRIENKLNIPDCKCSKENPLYEIMQQSWCEVGYCTQNNNQEANIGTGITRLLTRDGKRLNTAKVYLRDISNLHVMKNSYVRKVNIDLTTKAAISVEINHNSGTTINIRAKSEIILSAGSIATPKLLMHSGVGPKTHLGKHGITCIADLPVGQNLQDHAFLPLFLKTKQQSVTSVSEIMTHLIQYMSTRTGPLTNIGITDFMAFISTSHSNYPDIQFHHTYFTVNDTFILRSYLKGVGFEQNIIEKIMDMNKKSDLLGLYPTLLHPKSRGEVLLADSNVKTEPIIKSNYFKDPDDLQTFLKSLEFVNQLCETSMFKKLGIELTRLDLPGCSISSTMSGNEYWECYIRHLATTVYHPVGTAKMAPLSKQGVVNEDLLVHGINKLRVVDASIMPYITGGNTMGPTMAIAENAVDIIIKQYNLIKTEL